MRKSSLWLLLGSTMLMACSDGSFLTPSKKSVRMTPMFDAKANPAAYAGLTPQQRMVIKASAIDSILRLIPPEHRAEGKGVLTGTIIPGLPPGARPVMTGLAGSTNPEIARLMGVINAVRIASSAPQRARDAAEAAASEERFKRSVQVMVALSPSLPAGVRARVIRMPNDNGRVTLVLNDGHATPSDLDFGLDEAAKAFLKYGKVPAAQQVIDFPATGSPAGDASPSVKGMLAYLREAPVWNVPGVGQAQATLFATHFSAADQAALNP